MKSLLLAVAVASVPVSTAWAEHVEFSGSLCFTDANQTCNANGWYAGTCFASRFQPPNLGDAGTATNLSLFGRTFASNLASGSGSLVGTTYQSVTVTKIGSVGYQFPASMRFTSQSPATPSASTQTLTLAGDIAGWDQISGCTVKFKASHTLCPRGGYC